MKKELTIALSGVECQLPRRSSISKPAPHIIRTTSFFPSFCVVDPTNFSIRFLQFNLSGQTTGLYILCNCFIYYQQRVITSYFRPSFISDISYYQLLYHNMSRHTLRYYDVLNEWLLILTTLFSGVYIFVRKSCVKNF